MSLRFIYGRAGSGKSSFCLNDIKARLDAGDTAPLILLVPEQFSLQSERNLVKATGAGGIMRADVLSFRRMAYRVFNEAGGLTRRHINAAGKCMLICKAADGVKDKLGIFSKAINQKGFIKSLSDMIAELKRYNITPELMADMAGKAMDNEILRDKLSDIGAIYAEFERMTHESYMDSDDDLTELYNRLDKSAIYDGAEIWMDEFTSFTPQEYKVIGALMKKTGRLNISLCTDCLSEDYSPASTEVFAPVKGTVRKLMRLAKENGIAVEAPVALKHESACRYKESKEIGHLEHHFFSYPYVRYPHKTSDISIFTAVNPYTEVESTARSIIGLCRDRGMRYRDIAVVSRNLAAYEKLIDIVFTAYGIPYFIDRKKDIDGNPLVRLISSALDIFVNNWSYESVFRYLKTGLTNIERESIDLLENYVLACGIKGSRWTQDEDWDYRFDTSFDTGADNEYEHSMLIRVNEIRRAAAAPLADFRSKIKGRKSAREICTALYELLCSLGVPERIENWVAEFREAGELNLSNEYGQVWNIVMEVFDQVVEVAGNENMSIERFQRILSIGFGEYKIGLIPPALDQVLVGSVERSKNHDISALFIIGVNDGVFPAVSNDDGILTDRDREGIHSMGVELAGDNRTRAFEEQYLIYTTLATPSKYLRVSYPIADHEGRSMRLSIIVSRLRKLYPAIYEGSNIVDSDSDEDVLELAVAPVPAFNELIASLRRCAEGSETSSFWWDVYRWYMCRDEWRGKCSTALQGLTYSNQAGEIKPQTVRKLYGRPMHASISRLESFASCPFSYFVQYGLKARERKVFKLASPDVGTFMHRTIDIFSRRLNEQGLNWRGLDREQCAREVSVIVDEQLAGMPGNVLNSSERYMCLAKRLKRVLARAVWLIVQHIMRGGFDPVGYEVAFGDGELLPPITIELPSGDIVNLAGRIDRIDMMKADEGTYMRIIDYKSGQKSFKLSDVYYGLQIQLITYLSAALENGINGVDGPVLPGGILYFRLDDPLIRSDGNATDEEIEKAIMKQLRMKGLVLADVKLIREMDREIEGESDIIPARINKGDVLGKSSAATAGQFRLLCSHVGKLLGELSGEILKGNIDIRPYKLKKQTPCSYCAYSSVCQFDTGIKNNTYRLLGDLKDDDVWKLIGNDESKTAVSEEGGLNG